MAVCMLYSSRIDNAIAMEMQREIDTVVADMGDSYKQRDRRYG